MVQIQSYREHNLKTIFTLNNNQQTNKSKATDPIVQIYKHSSELKNIAPSKKKKNGPNQFGQKKIQFRISNMVPRKKLFSINENCSVNETGFSAPNMVPSLAEVTKKSQSGEKPSFGRYQPPQPRSEEAWLLHSSQCEPVISFLNIHTAAIFELVIIGYAQFKQMDAIFDTELKRKGALIG